MPALSDKIELAHDFREWLRAHREINRHTRHSRKFLFAAFVAGRDSARRRVNLTQAAAIQRAIQPSLN